MVTSDHSFLRFITTAIDLKTTASTALTPVSTRKFIPTAVTFHYKTVTSLTVVASISLGSNSTAFDNLQAIGVLGANTAVTNTLVSFPLTTLAALDVSTNGLTLKVTTGATATTLTADVHVTGYYAE
jgi:hypothetical protein